MSNEVAKYIDCTGDVMSLKVIELACALALSSCEKDEECGHSLAIALQYMGCDLNAVIRHGWAEITGYTAENKHCGGEKDMVSIHTLTPYGNLKEVMAELRAKFPLCEFHCYNDREEENEFD
jgi:hypothetical protein